MGKTFEEINEKIRNGTVVVATAEEIIDIVEEMGIKEAAKQAYGGLAAVDTYTGATELSDTINILQAEVQPGKRERPTMQPRLWCRSHAVAGAIAQHVGEELSKFSREIIVENGGDIYITESPHVKNRQFNYIYYQKDY